MKKKYIQKIVIFFLKLRSSFTQKDNVVNIFDAFSSARSLLITMPHQAEEFVIAHKYVNSLKERYSRSDLTLIIPSVNKNLLNLQGNYGMIFVDNNNVNWLGLPKKGLTEKMNASTYDIAIDLNYRFNLLSTFLCQKSDAILRVCMQDSHRELFFNINISLPVNKSLDEKYQSFINYISSSAKSAK